ncbi:hypothetical protein BDA99DRAFT_539650 [Phascolomyces articulosus]|uniref:Uncharacterized protein n=1 Tax=Phascolomyces articulosus TaxID=60185 RepID=A0AAD5JVY7_9FUNG|nr:hypothetical protein BDA99DRAFT_539650 [Phascolomyces articulosus]
MIQKTIYFGMAMLYEEHSILINYFMVIGCPHFDFITGFFLFNVPTLIAPSNALTILADKWLRVGSPRRPSHLTLSVEYVPNTLEPEELFGEFGSNQDYQRV